MRKSTVEATAASCICRYKTDPIVAQKKKPG